MGDKGTVWLPEGASSFAGEIDALFYFVYWTSVVLFVGVVAAMIYLAVRYRRSKVQDVPVPVKENKLLEISWVVVPTILVLIVFTWGFRAFLHLGIAPPSAYEINVTGVQWAWQFQYPNGTVTGNEFAVPVGKPVKMVMSSTDVLHSFYIPAFRVKHDVLPDRYTSVWFEPTKVGEYDVYCTEYCGTQHSGMLAKVKVMSQDDFDTWLQEQSIDPNASPVELGEALFTREACVGCHSIDGSRKVGPSFAGLFGKQEQLADGTTVEVDENYLREAILEPGASIVAGYPNVMPSYSRLDEQQVSALVAYIKSLQ